MNTALREEVWTWWKSIGWGAWSYMIDCREATRALDLSNQLIGLQNNCMCERPRVNVVDTGKAIDESPGLIG
jgi:hypothetical protein